VASDGTGRGNYSAAVVLAIKGTGREAVAFEVVIEGRAARVRERPLNARALDLVLAEMAATGGALR